MATLQEVADDLAYTLGRPHDEGLKEIIKYNAKILRAVYVRRRAERDGDSGLYNQRMVVALQKVDKADTCVASVDCTVLRTVNKVPLPLVIKADTAPFKFVGNLDQSEPFVFVEIMELNGLMSINPIKDTHYYAYINGYVYVFNIKMNRMKRLSLLSLFADPEKVKDDCSDTNCYSDVDSEFPVDQDILALIKQDILKLGLTGLTKSEVSIDEEQSA